jgi:tetratricopeptide (TPR) repeat protein
MAPFYRIGLLAAAVGCAFHATLPAQEKVPKRPRLPTTTDTTSPLAYYRFALQTMEREPKLSADALYWAIRLNPSWAAALYSRRVALLRSDERRLVRYLDGDRRAIREFASSDSLYFRALQIDPFLHDDLERPLLRHYFAAYFREQVSRSGGNSQDASLQVEIEREINRIFATETGDGYRAREALGDRRLPEALALYTTLIGRAGKKPTDALREDRATVFYLMRQFDSAAADLRLAIDERAKKDAKETVFLYRSKALLHHKLAMALIQRGDLEGGLGALGKALEEDLAFYPAHLMLANMAMTRGDSATAFREYDLAIELQPEEALPHLARASALVAGGRRDLAIPALRKIIAIEPFFAKPHLDLARLLDENGDHAAAVEEYKAFLARVPATDPARAQVDERIRALGAAATPDAPTASPIR